MIPPVCPNLDNLHATQDHQLCTPTRREHLGDVLRNIPAAHEIEPLPEMLSSFKGIATGS